MSLRHLGLSGRGGRRSYVGRDNHRQQNAVCATTGCNHVAAHVDRLLCKRCLAGLRPQRITADQHLVNVIRERLGLDDLYVGRVS